MPRILVVDDEEFMRALCGRVLGAMGHEIRFADSLAAALGQLRTLPSLDMVVSDLRLPDGNGTEVVRAALEKFPGAAALVMTAYPDADGRREELLALGVDDASLLIKPFDISELEAAVNKGLGGAGRA